LLFGFSILYDTLNGIRGILLNHFVELGKVERAVDGFYGFGHFGFPLNKNMNTCDSRQRISVCCLGNKKNDLPGRLVVR